MKSASKRYFVKEITVIDFVSQILCYHAVQNQFANLVIWPLFNYCLKMFSFMDLLLDVFVQNF